MFVELSRRQVRREDRQLVAVLPLRHELVEVRDREAVAEIFAAELRTIGAELESLTRQIEAMTAERTRTQPRQRSAAA